MTIHCRTHFDFTQNSKYVANQPNSRIRTLKYCQSVSIEYDYTWKAIETSRLAWKALFCSGMKSVFIRFSLFMWVFKRFPFSYSWRWKSPFLQFSFLSHYLSPIIPYWEEYQSFHFQKIETKNLTIAQSTSWAFAPPTIGRRESPGLPKRSWRHLKLDKKTRARTFQPVVIAFSNPSSDNW